MEEIKKAIEEEIDRYLYETDGWTTKRCSMEYISNFILSKWQDSERWRKVEDELPEKKDKGYFILVRSEDIMDAFYVYPNTNYEYLRDWKEWKPID